MNADPKQAQRAWQEVNKILGVALQLDPAEQSEFLRNACNGNRRLRLEVEEMMAAVYQAQSESFLGVDAFAVGARVMAVEESATNTMPESISGRARRSLSTSGH